MRIGIVMHPYGEKKPGGLPRIIFGWTQGLLSVDRENEYSIFFKEQPLARPLLPGSNWTTYVLGAGRFWLDRLRYAPQADVYLFNTPVLPLFWKPPKSVVIVLDYPYKYLKARNLKERLFRFFISWYHRRSLRRADHIIAVSESTKRDTMRFFDIPADKITVVYHGFTDVCKLPEQSLSLPEKFFFFAGTIKERKNVLNIVKAFELFQARCPDATHRLVLAGKNEGPYYEAVLSYIREKGIESNVVFMGHLDESQLSYAYKRAEALIFPSIVEGTGFPILEAMSCGLPVITSNIFGPAEMGGNDGAVLIDPYDPLQIALAMERLVSDTAFRQEQVRLGLKQAKRFDWNTTGRETLGVLTRTAHS